MLKEVDFYSITRMRANGQSGCFSPANDHLNSQPVTHWEFHLRQFYDHDTLPHFQ